MTANNHPLSQEEFDSIYSKVPRLTVEIIIKNDKGEIFLTKRALEPCKGQWHLPGGTVHFGELMTNAVKRIAHRELSIIVTTSINKGYIEYPNHFEQGLDSPVGIVFEVTEFSGNQAIDAEATDSGWFSEIPDDMHTDQDQYLLENHYLIRKSETVH